MDSTTNVAQDAEYTEVEPQEQQRALQTLAPPGLSPVRIKADMAAALENDKAIVEFMREGMVPGVDYGVIPGTKTPTLLQPGGEKLCRLFNLGVRYSQRVRYLNSDHIDVDTTAILYRRDTGSVIGEADGSASSMESKWRYRHAERVCPECGASAIIKGKAEFGGGWICFDKKGGCKAKFADSDPRITEQITGLVENPNIADQWNTVKKISAKRAFLSSVKNSLGASGLFTVDLDDIAENASVHRAPAASVVSQGAPPSTPRRESKPQPTVSGSKGNWYRATVLDCQEIDGKSGPGLEYTLEINGNRRNYVKCWEYDRAVMACGEDPASYRGELDVLITEKPNPRNAKYPYLNIDGMRAVDDANLAPPIDLDENPSWTPGS